MEDCIFCKIANKQEKAEIVYEDEEFVVFKDINPKADIHLLIVPKKHIESVNELSEEDIELIGRMFLIPKRLKEKFPEAKDGYNLVFNVGKGGGQIINHLHLHFLAGKRYGWP